MSIYVCEVNIEECRSDCFRFLNVVARWPGSSHDSTILHNSEIEKEFESHAIDGFLLGDSG